MKKLPPMNGRPKERIVTVGDENDVATKIIALMREEGMDVFPFKTTDEADVFCRQNKKLDLVIHFLPSQPEVKPIPKKVDVDENDLLKMAKLAAT